MSAKHATESRWHWWAPIAALAAVVYTPLLLTQSGRVVADGSSTLFLDPSRLISRATSMWDPHVGLGTVPHDQIGHLWPVGPFFWLADAASLPMWVAQRLWIGTILVAAGAGVMFLARTWRWTPAAAAAAAFTYALSPFVLVFAGRESALMLPFAGLPWLFALAVRATRSKGWRHPALFALVVTTVGSINTIGLVIVGAVPAAWIVYASWSSERISRARATSTLAKIGVLTVAVNLWWIGGSSVEATNGMDVAEYGETARSIADASSAPELLRGLGNHFFYGDDRLGQWIAPSDAYTQTLWLLALTYAIPALGLLALGVVRWRHRSFVVALLAVGAVVAVGAHTWDDPSILGFGFRELLESDAGLALRGLPNAVPLIALACALGLGSAVAAVTVDHLRAGLASAGAVALVAVLALPPLWTGDFVPEKASRPEQIPDYWNDAAAAVDSPDGSAGTRVLALPGSEFATYRWGTTGDPILPGLIDRPFVARDRLPAGSAASTDLLNALDTGMQERALSPRALAAVARLMNVGDVLVRNDLQYERFDTARPRTVADVARRAAGLGEATSFGPDSPNLPSEDVPLLDEFHLAGDGALPDPSAIEIYPVESPQPIVRAVNDESMVILSGDGAGIVDAAAAGLIDGTELIRYSASLTDDPTFVTTDLVEERALIVTDTNRLRGERWATIHHTQGYTEQVDGGTLATDDIGDRRLDVFEDRGGINSVSEQREMSARATGYGNPITFEPDNRPANAADGDLTTSWRTASSAKATGERLELTADGPVTTDEIVLRQSDTGFVNRWITEVELRFDGDHPLRVVLDESSRSGAGQTIDIGSRTFGTLSIEIVADSAGRPADFSGLSSVGFAEVRVADLRIDELIRMPTDLLSSGGFRTQRYPLAIVQTRERTSATDVTRDDEEHAIERTIELPTQRQYRLTGTAHLSARAPMELIDAILGRGDPQAPRVSATSVLPGGLRSAPSNVLDDDAATWWTSAFGIADGERLEIDLTEAAEVTSFNLTFVDDAEHSVPTSVAVAGEGVPEQTIPIVDAVDRGDGTRTARIELADPAATETLTLTFGIDARTTIDWQTEEPETLPIAIAEMDLGPEVRVPAYADSVDSGCRTDLLTVDGNAVSVRITGTTEAALSGYDLDVAACEGPIVIPGGDHDMRAVAGRDTGWDLDQLVWCSAGGGSACAADGPLIEASDKATPTVEITSEDDTTIEVAISGATEGEDFWLVLGQSFNDGWIITDSEVPHEATQLVNGFANGFMIKPTSDSFTLKLHFAPQNRVEVTFLLSLLGVATAVLLSSAPARAVGPPPIPRIEPLRRIRALSWEGALPTRTEARWVGVGVGAATLIIVNPVVGVVAGVVASFATRREAWRILFTVVPSAALALCGLYAVVSQLRYEYAPGPQWVNDTGRLHDLGLLAVLLLLTDVVIERVWERGTDLP